MDIWDILFCANHINISEYELISYMAVGVGPLTFNGDYVEQGSPMECLKGNVRFMSERMKIKCPPLPPSTKKEFVMIK